MACDAEKRTLLATRYNGNKQYQFIHCTCNQCIQWTHGGIIVSMLISGSGCLASSPGQGHFVVVLGRTPYSDSAYSPPRCIKILANLMLGVTLMD